MTRTSGALLEIECRKKVWRQGDRSLSSVNSISSVGALFELGAIFGKSDEKLGSF